MIDRNIASKAGFWFPGIVRNFQVALQIVKGILHWIYSTLCDN